MYSYSIQHEVWVTASLYRTLLSILVYLNNGLYSLDSASDFQFLLFPFQAPLKHSKLVVTFTLNSFFISLAESKNLYIFLLSFIFTRWFANAEKSVSRKLPFQYRTIGTMVWETGVQSPVESYQRLKKWYLMPPCLTHSIIRYGSRVSEAIQEKESCPPLHLGVVVIEKRAFGSPLNSVGQLTNLLFQARFSH